MITTEHKNKLKMDLDGLEKHATEIFNDPTVSNKIKGFVKIELNTFRNLIKAFFPEELLK